MNVSVTKIKTDAVFLGKIADIHTGYTFRSALDDLELGQVGVIQMRDLGDNNQINFNNIQHVSVANLKANQLLQNGDLIFRSRGMSLSAAVVQGIDGPAIVAAPLLRIRINTKALLPNFLAWYIDQPAAQAHFAEYAEGSTQKMIGKAALGKLPLPLPPLSLQQAVAELATLAQQEAALSKRLSQLRQQYLSATLMNKILGSHA